MSTCSIQNGGKRRGGKRSRGKKSYRGGNPNPDVPAYNPTTPTPVPTSAPAPEDENNNFFSGLASGFSSFTQTVGNSVKKGVSAIRASQPHPDQATLAPSPSTSSAQLGGRRRKKAKTMRKSKKARRFKHKRSRKSKH
jgi:hypothetical protein